MQGISVNRVHGDEESIASIQRRYQPEVESMEGASFFYCALSEHIPFLQLRAISNRVEKRNRDAWDIPRAIQRLNETTIKILEELLFDQP
jgi:futalosine hydrolase